MTDSVLECAILQNMKHMIVTWAKCMTGYDKFV